MLDGLVGQSLTRQLDLSRAAAPLTGATVTYTLTGPAGTALLTAAATTSSTPGIYSLALDGGTTLTASGLYREQWTVTSGSDEYPVESWFVLGAWEPGLLPCWELRHRVAEEVRDLTLGVATGGTSLTLVDTERIEPAGHWEGAELTLYAGPGRGQSRNVPTSVVGTCTVATAWATTPVAGTRYELHTRFKVAEYNHALNRALDLVRGHMLRPIVWANLTATDADLEIAIPAPFQTVRAVWWRADPQPTTTPEDAWTLLPGDEWWLQAGRRLIFRGAPQDQQLQLVGETAYGEFASDDVLFDGPSEYLIYRAAAILLGSRLTAAANDAPGYRDQLLYLEARAKEVEPKRRVRPNSRRVP